MRIAITLRQLEIFLAVTRGGQVTRAAKALHLTQSATSMALAQLERHLQTALFERAGRTLKLTERGHLLMAAVPELLTRVSELPGLLSGRDGDLRGELRVAASTTVGRYLLAPALAAFAVAHPLVGVRPVIGNTEAATAALYRFDADVAFVEGSVWQPELIASVWRTDTLEIVGSAGLWKDGSRRLSRAQFAKMNWIMREPGSGTREVFERALLAAKLPPAQVLMTLNDSEAVAQVVASGVGVACLPRLVVANGLHNKRLVMLHAPYLALERTLWQVKRRGATSGPIQESFMAFLNEAR